VAADAEGVIVLCVTAGLGATDYCVAATTEGVIVLCLCDRRTGGERLLCGR
jgi:hypothetical protein